VEIRSEGEIRESLLAAVIAQTGVTDVQPGGLAVQVGAAVAAELAATEVAIATEADDGRLSLARGAALSAWGEDVLPAGRARAAATFAAGGAFIFYASVAPAADVVLRRGFPVLRGTDGVRYVTAAETTIAAGHTSSAPSVSVVCAKTGTLGNCASGEINRLGEPLAGVTGCENLSPLFNGLDEQDDDAYREAIRSDYRTMGPGSSPRALLELARETSVEGFGSVMFAALSKPAESPTGPTVALYVDDGAGTAGPQVSMPAETLLAVAQGGEHTFYLSAPPTVGAVPLLVNGAPYAGAYVYEPSLGRFVVTDGGIAALDVVSVDAYLAYGGLVAEVQRGVTGDLTDEETYPGRGGAGVTVRVLPAVVEVATVAARVTLKTGIVWSEYEARLQDVVIRNINAHGIGVPAYASEVSAALIATGLVANVVSVAINGAATLNVAANKAARTSRPYVTLT
jgi:hypothetical protein